MDLSLSAIALGEIPIPVRNFMRYPVVEIISSPEWHREFELPEEIVSPSDMTVYVPDSTLTHFQHKDPTRTCDLSKILIYTCGIGPTIEHPKIRPATSCYYGPGSRFNRALLLIDEFMESPSLLTNLEYNHPDILSGAVSLHKAAELRGLKERASILSVMGAMQTARAGVVDVRESTWFKAKEIVIITDSQLVYKNLTWARLLKSGCRSMDQDGMPVPLGCEDTVLRECYVAIDALISEIELFGPKVKFWWYDGEGNPAIEQGVRASAGFA